jgi:hypothetical protein
VLESNQLKIHAPYLLIGDVAIGVDVFENGAIFQAPVV